MTKNLGMNYNNVEFSNTTKEDTRYPRPTYAETR
jgi:hypothetical protein